MAGKQIGFVLGLQLGMLVVEPEDAGRLTVACQQTGARTEPWKQLASGVRQDEDPCKPAEAIYIRHDCRSVLTQQPGAAPDGPPGQQSGGKQGNNLIAQN